MILYETFEKYVFGPILLGPLNAIPSEKGLASALRIVPSTAFVGRLLPQRGTKQNR